MSAELLGIPAEFEHAGTLYKLGPATQKAKGLYEKLLGAIALKNVREMKDVLSPVDYQTLYDATSKSVATGQYKTGKPAWAEIGNTEDGGIAFVLSLFRVNHPDMTESQCRTLLEEKPDECNQAVLEVAPGFFHLAFPTATVEQIEVAILAVKNSMPSLGNSKPTTKQSVNSMAL